MLLDLESAISRKKFLSLAVKVLAITSLGSMNLGCHQRHPSVPLIGLSFEEYANMVCIQEVFLRDCPIEFDLGIALDNYIYASENTIPSENFWKEIARLPSSYIASITLDHSIRPLAKLNPVEREERLLSWRSSINPVKRGLYQLFHQISFYLLSKNKNYQLYIGYIIQ